MEKKIEHKERINYVVSHHEDGKVSYTGKSLNYNACCSSWESIEDLEKEMKAMISMWLEFGKETIEGPGLEMKEVTEEEWNALEDNIDYWEIERIKRLLKRPGIQEWLKELIVPAMYIKNGLNEMQRVMYTEEIVDYLANLGAE